MWRRRASLALLVLLAVSPAGAGEQRLVLDPGDTRIGFRLGATAHDVEGEFALRTGEIRFDPETGSASGQVEVDLTVGRTGNKKRDRTMHERVLETARFPLAVFRPTRLVGSVALDGESSVSVQGVLAFHGADHEMGLDVKVTCDGARCSAETTFDIPYVAWGLEDPSFLFLRVKKVVQVHVTAQGTIR